MIMLHGIPYAPEFPAVLGYNAESETAAADLRVCFCFPSSPEYRVLSRTHDVLYSTVKQAFGSRVFVDFAFAPVSTVAGALKAEHLPEWYGVISHAPVRDFDVVGVSIAVSGTEIFEAYRLMSESGLLRGTRTTRGPFMLLGGTAADTALPLFRHFDAVLLGFAEQALPSLLSCLLAHSGYTARLERLSSIPGVLISDVQRTAVQPNVNLIPSDLVLPGTAGLPFHSYQHKAIVPVSIGCLGQSCLFCHEGQMQGVWRERPAAQVCADLRATKAATLDSDVSFQSFSLNLYSDLQTIMEEAVRQFDGVDVMNFRADVLTQRPDLLLLLSKLGVTSLAFAVEGLGQRIRDLLKKGLSYDQLIQAVKATAASGISRLKLGYMATGYEIQADIMDGARELLDISLAASGSRLFLNYTDLVHYPGTPLYAEPRLRSLDLLREIDTGKLAPRLFEEAEDYGFSVKYAESGGRSYITQLLFDLGYEAEDLLLVPYLESGLSYSEPEFARLVVSGLAKKGISYEQLFLRQQMPKRYRYDSSIFDGYFTKAARASTDTCRESCVGCGQCADLDIEQPAFKFKPLDVDRIEALLLENAPAFTYEAMFRVGAVYQHTSKDVLLRRVLAQSVDPRAVRRVYSSVIEGFEKDRYPVSYYGMVPVTIESSRPLLHPFVLQDDCSLESFKQQDQRGLPWVQRTDIEFPVVYLERVKALLNEYVHGKVFRYRGTPFYFQYQTYAPELLWTPSLRGVKVLMKADFNPLWLLSESFTMATLSQFHVHVLSLSRGSFADNKELDSLSDSEYDSFQE